VSARFHVSFAPAGDWWPEDIYPKKTDASIADTKYDRGRPEPAFLFGVRDVDVDQQEDPKTHKEVLVRPMRGLGVRVKPDAVELYEFVETKRKRGPFDSTPDEMTITVKQSQKADFANQQELDVAVEVAGDSVKVTAGGKTFSFAAPKDRTGFYGLNVRGTGYVELSRLKVASRLQ
jgi:hypothetical protein